MKASTNCLIVSALLLCGCSSVEKKPIGWIDEARLLNADQEAGNWMSLGRNFMQQHHSTLSLIDTSNVQGLGFAWQYETNSNRGRVHRGLEATPIIVDGIMYTSGAWSQVYALDAKTGKELWRFDPEADGNYARRACCDVVNRGVQVWKGKVYWERMVWFAGCRNRKTDMEARYFHRSQSILYDYRSAAGSEREGYHWELRGRIWCSRLYLRV
jgi:quinohemoprotein ethanol dehydrogenase